tara:strand:+ start:114 stop:254 length:141 start_codon:yes stop_codon:yes gene_type:complete
MKFPRKIHFIYKIYQDSKKLSLKGFLKLWENTIKTVVKLYEKIELK